MDVSSTAPLIINLGTNCRWVVNFTVQSPYPLKRSLVPVGGWVGPIVGLDVLEKRRHFASTGIRSPDAPAGIAVPIRATPLREVMLCGCDPTWWFECPTLAGNLAMSRYFLSWGLEDLNLLARGTVSLKHELCGQDEEFLNVTVGGTQSYRCHWRNKFLSTFKLM